MKFTIAQTHQVEYFTTVEADTKEEALAMVQEADYADWTMNENTLVESGDLFFYQD